MAAATTSLPETPGGARNWDYRFTWIRDSSFMLRALYRLGFGWEAIEYWGFVLDAVSGGDLNRKFELQIMYGIGGERDLTEKTLDYLSGYEGARPVRIGNGAWNQQQHDVWGMILDALDVQFHRGAEQIVAPVWEGLAGFVDDALEHWREPDQGIWEVRGEPKHFTASKVMCWVAAARGADLADERGDEQRAKRWRAGADKIKADVLAKDVSKRGVFRQHDKTDDLDASLLLLPIMGFLPPDDERIKATVLAIADELTEDGLVLRYRTDQTDTGFSGKEGTFTICSFWLVSALAMIGETDARPRPVPKTALVRRAAAAVRRGDRRHHRAAPGELPAGLHPPGPHRRRVQAHRDGVEGRLRSGDGLTPGPGRRVRGGPGGSARGPYLLAVSWPPWSAGQQGEHMADAAEPTDTERAAVRHYLLSFQADTIRSRPLWIRVRGLPGRSEQAAAEGDALPMKAETD